MFRRTTRILVAVSGGADSVATLLVMLRLGHQLGFEVTAAHFDHKLRATSAHDLAFVRQLCDERGVSCSTGEGDVGAAARERRDGVEAVARQMRYQFLGFIAERERADCVVTGHTADDQAETVLMRIVRGSGVRGIRGMLPVAAVPGMAAQRLVRPALCLDRTDTEAICAEAGIVPLSDPSNADTNIPRNRVRHESLASLRNVNPSVGDALRRLAANAREAFALVERQAMAAQPLERGPVGSVFAVDVLASLANEGRTLVLEREAAFFHLEPEINATRIRNLQSVLAKKSGSVRFGDTAVEVSSGKVRIGPPLDDVEPFVAKVMNVPGVTLAGPWRVVVSTSPLVPVAGSLSAAIGTGHLRGVLRLAPLCAGDRMQYHGFRRLASDVLKAARVPLWSRVGVVALTDATGVVALFSSAGVFTDESQGDDVLYVQVGMIAETPSRAARVTGPQSAG